MKRRKSIPDLIEVRAILESPVGRISTGAPIGAYEAGMRRAAGDASKGKMGAARRFLGELEKYGLLKLTDPADEHQYVLRIPKEWEREAWHAMYEEYGPPPWPGPFDGLIPLERWKAHYGTRPRPLRRSGRARR